MPGTSPTVDTVMWRAPKRIPAGSTSRVIAPNVPRSFAIGSPMPMNTTFVSRRGVDFGSLTASRRAHRAWAAI